MIGADILKRATQIGESMQADQRDLRASIASNDLVYFKSDQIESGEGIPRLFYNHRWSKSRLWKFVGGAKATLNQKLADAVKAAIIEQPIQNKGNGNYSFYESEVHALLDYWGYPRYSIKLGDQVKKLKKMAVCVANQKGGIGKTSTAIHLGVATAIDYQLRARVLVIDFDPQGSTFQYISNAPQEQLYLTMADILLGKDYEDGDFSKLLGQISESDIIKKAPFQTHLDGLNIIPAHPSDSRLSDLITSASDEEKRKIFDRFNNVILPALFEEYDIIMFDTAPVDSPMTWLALDATNYLLTPLSPKEMDYASTAAFLKGLEPRISGLPSKGSNLMLHKIVLTNHDAKSEVENETKYRIANTAQGNLLTAEFTKSDAFTAAARNCRTVLDIKPGDGLCSKSALTESQNSVKNVYNQYIMAMRTVN